MADKTKSKPVRKSGSCLAWQSLLLCQAIAVGLSPMLPLSAMAQTAPSTTTTPSVPTTPTINSPAVGTTILPTDVVPLADRDAYKTPIGELLQLKIMQRLPSNLYFSSSVEVTGRDETNPFQFPLKRTLLSQLPRPATWRQLSARDQASLYDILGEVARNNMIFRVLPNVSGGWAFTPSTRIFTNYFMIRDQLAHSMRLNTVIHSYAIGLQHTVPLGAKGSLQFEIQGRELWQLHQQSVFDYLPGITASYIATPRSVIFVNALIQARGKAPLQAPTKELDPFYTWGGLYQKNGWTFSASTTFVQNFREPFHHNATIPKNSYVLISDFEVARRVMKQYPGLQAFIRAEPIWNFHSHNTPSLAGMDFRLFFGFRFAMAKQALTSTLMQIREQLQETDTVKPTPSTSKPSASLPIENSISLNPQPIHGFLDQDSLAETCMSPGTDTSEIASKDSGAPDTQNLKSPAENDQTSSIASAQKELLSNASNSANAHAVTLSSLDKVENAPVIDISKAVANANSTAERTLEAIANASSPDFNTHTQGEQAKILDLTSTPIDWHELESVSTQLVAAAADQVAFNAMINQVAEESNTLAQEERANKIKALAEKQEREFKIALAPVVPTLPTRTINQNQFQIKAAVAPPKMAQVVLPLPKAIKPEQLAAPTTLSATSVPPQSQLNLPQPSALKATQFAFGQTKPVEKAPQAMATLPELKELDLRTNNKQLKPLHQASETVASHNGIIPPSVISSEKSSAEPVPMISKAVVAPNKIPAPVSAKLPVPTGILPSAKTVDKTLLAEKSISSDKASTAAKVASKDGIIPLSELKVEKASEAKQVIASVFNPQVSAPTITATPSSVPAKSAVTVQPVAPTTKPAVAVTPAVPAATKPAVAVTPAVPAATKQAVAVTPTVPAATKPAVAVTPAVPAATKPAVAVTPTVPAATKPTVATVPTTSIKQAAVKPQSIASSMSSNRPLDSIRPSRSVTDFAKPIQSAPAVQAESNDDNMLAVSGLDSDISSPKIAMALYDNWQSPVLDDPLISSGQNQSTSELNIPEIKSHSATGAEEKRKAEKKRTDMKLIPPFPTVGSKDNPLKDLQIPVIPH